jgi:putative ABC transport system permease protein
MTLWSRLRSWLEATLRRSRMESEMDVELRFHVEAHAENLVRGGIARDEAMRRARLEFGGAEQIKEECREARGVTLVESLVQDLRYGVRMFVKNPGFTVAAVIALALGIGANTALFGVVNGVLLRPLPYRDPSRLVVVSLFNQKIQETFPLCDADFLDWRAQNQVFTAVAAFSGNRFNITGSGVPEQILGDTVTAEFFSTLGVKPVLGRTFLPNEDRPGSPRLVVLSYSIWQRRYSSNPGVIGQTIVLNGSNSAVIGIMPPRFLPSPEIQLWTNLVMEPPTFRGPYYLTGQARLKPGVTIEQARAELGIIAHRIEQQNPLTNSNMNFLVRPLEEAIVGDVRPALLVLLGAVAFVLLIASANVANLLLARAAVREKEVAIRAALGASRARLTRQLLTESVLLAAIGGLLGLLLARWGVRLLLELRPGNLPRLEEIAIDGRVLGFTCLISLASGILFGLVPAVQSGRSDLNKVLKEGGRSAADGQGRSRMRSVLVVAEIALSVVLLAGAGLMLKSFLRLQAVSPGINPDNALTMQITLPQRQYHDDSQLLSFYQHLLEKVQTLPGVDSAGVGMSLPPNLLEVTDYFTIEGQEAVSERMLGLADLVFVSPDYFRALGVPLVKGRYFTAADRVDSAKIAIVNQTLAHHYWPNENPIGKRLKTGGAERPKSPWMEVVGVVGDIKYSGLDAAPELELYEPYQQAAWPSMYLVVRTSSELRNPATLASAVQNAVWSLDKDLPVAHIRTMRQLLSESVEQPRFRTVLLEVFALIALSLATVGIYGVLAYSVSQRRHEIGVRMAMGAKRSDVLWMVVGQGMFLTLIGVAIGVAGAFVLTRFLSTLLYGVRPTDPVTFVVVPLLLACVALFACYVPARRAIRVDPMAALRYE